MTFHRSDDLIYAEVDNEAVALSVAKGECYGLDEVGLRILKILDTPSTIARICEALIAEYDVDPKTCERDVHDLLRQLETEGLVTVERSDALT